MAKPQQRSAVMADVAELAGVSRQTISRVTNGTGYVAPATRERVLKAMRTLNYQPNSAAQALVRGRSRTVGVVARETTDYGPTAILLGLERAARERGYRAVTAKVARPDAEAVFEAIDELHRQQVEGIVLHIGLPENAVELTTPAVTLEDAPAVDIGRVVVNQAAGAAKATRLLLDLGHRGIAHVAGPLQSGLARQRLEAWEAALTAAGVTEHVSLTGDWSAQSGFDLGTRLAARDDVTAVFAANDAMALGVMRALHEAGRSVPGDVSVVGWDDIPEARFFTPPLTTVRQDFELIGRTMLSLLLGVIDGEDSRPHVSLEPELIVRGSTSAR